MATTYHTLSARIRFICTDTRSADCTGATESPSDIICTACRAYRAEHGKPRHTKSDAIPPTKRIKPAVMINPCIDCNTTEASAPARVCEACQRVRMTKALETYWAGSVSVKRDRREAHRKSRAAHVTAAATTTGTVVRTSRKWSQTAGLSKDEARKLRRQLRKESRGG